MVERCEHIDMRPNTGSRKSWAAGDATSRAVRLALIAKTGEMGYATALSAPKWGFQDVVFGGNKVTLHMPLGSYVMENILFKISFPGRVSRANGGRMCAAIARPSERPIGRH